MKEKSQKAISASNGSVATGDEGYAAGRDMTVNNYLENKGVKPFKVFRGDPSHPIKDLSTGLIKVDDIRADLLLIDNPREKLPCPTPVRVRGTLYPCALLVSGWWTRREEEKPGVPIWDNGLQAWLFHGFHEWGPSWDFTWDFESEVKTKNKSHFIAQLGDGDEANSIPVIITHERAKRLNEIFLERGHELGINLGGVEVEIKGLLTHRIHFEDHELKGFDLQQKDILNYCLWLKDGESSHEIKPLKREHNKAIYSGYLWKLIAPQKWVVGKKTISMNEAYFVWEHTNFHNQDSINYNLDSLEQKVSYIKNKHKEKYGEDDFILLQKSSLLVSGTPEWSTAEFYSFFSGETGEKY